MSVEEELLDIIKKKQDDAFLYLISKAACYQERAIKDREKELRDMTLKELSSISGIDLFLYKNVDIGSIKYIINLCAGKDRTEFLLSYLNRCLNFYLFPLLDEYKPLGKEALEKEIDRIISLVKLDNKKEYV
jgi:hypothetical protein